MLIILAVICIGLCLLVINLINRYNRYLIKLKKGIRYREIKNLQLHKNYIYVYRDKIFIKIGKTRNIKKRLKTHQTAHALPLHILSIIPVANCDVAENYLHKKYKLFRINKREFFYMIPSVILELYILNNTKVVKFVKGGNL